jgi:DNA-binding transcriptional LysR family regulator
MTLDADGLSSRASSRCSTVMNSWRFCRASINALCKQISSYVTTPAIRSGKLKTVLSGFQVDSPAIWVMYPQNRHLTPRVRAFVDFLVEWAK